MRNANSLSPVQPSFDQKFQNVDTKMRKLLRRLLQFNPSNRASAEDCLSDPMFEDYRLETNEKQANYTITTDIDSHNCPITVKGCLTILKQQISKVKKGKLRKMLTIYNE